MVLAGSFAPIPQVSTHELLVFLLQVGVLLGAALVLGRLAVKLKLPAVPGELLAGAVVGPTLFGHLAPPAWRGAFPANARPGALFDALRPNGLPRLGRPPPSPLH